MLLDTITPGTGISSNYQYFSETYLFIVLLIVILQMRQRRVKMWTLMIMPVLMLLITVPMVYVELNSAFNMAIIGLAFIVGSGIGTLIGHLMEVKVDEKDGTMILKGSILVVALWAAIIVIKLYGKGLLGETGFISLDLLTSAFLTITLGTVIARRAVIYWKYRRMQRIAVKPPAQ